MTTLLKVVYRLDTIPIKLPMAFFTELEQKILPFVWKYKRPQITKAILRKRTELEVSCSQTSDYTAWYWHKNRHIDKWNRIEGPRINQHTYGKLIYDKGGKNIQWKKDSGLQ